MVKVTVLAVHDGDSIRVRDDAAGLIYWIRLYGYDSPEVYAPGYSVDQPFGRDAGVYLRSAIKGESVELIVKPKRDVWGRRVATVISPKIGDIGEYMLKAGMAWTGTPVNNNKLRAYRALQAAAQAARIGLWVGEKPTRPSLWRKRNLKRSAGPVPDPLFWADEKISFIL